MHTAHHAYTTLVTPHKTTPPPKTTGPMVTAAAGPGYVEGRTKLTHHEVSHNLAGSGSCVRPVRALSILDGPWKSSQRAHQKGLPWAPSPKGAAKKEVHTNRPQVAGRHSNTVNREARPHQSPTIQLYEWLRTQGQLSCLSCRMDGMIGG